MIKSFIFAAISVGYMFAGTAIVDAKLKISTEKPNRNQTCQKQQIASIGQDGFSTADIKAICQLITSHYRVANGNYLKHQLFIQNHPEKVDPGIRTLSIRFVDVTGLNLMPEVRDTKKSAEKKVKIQIVFDSEVYDWTTASQSWEVDKSLKYDDVKIEVEFYKRNGIWHQDPKNTYWDSEIKNSIESNSADTLVPKKPGF